jgi:hypothetical protein
MEGVVFALAVWSVACPVVLTTYYNWRLRNLVDAINHVNQGLNMRLAMLARGGLPPPPTAQGPMRFMTDRERAAARRHLRVPPHDGGPA